MKSITWIIILIYCKAAILPGAYANCTHKDFEDDWKLKYGIVIWANDDDDSVPGVLRCQEDYVFEGKTDLVYCKEEEFVALDGNAKCIEDPFVKTKVVQFQGQTYNYTKIDVGHKTYQFPMKNPNITYVITTNYTASKVTPTIRVKVHLSGKAHHPILVNIQQSTESVGFELPLKVVGKESEDLAVNYSTTVREMCNTRNLSQSRDEHLLFTIVSQEPLIHVHNPNFSDPVIAINVKVAQDAFRPLGESHAASAAPNEDQWFFFSWEGISDAIHFVVVNVTSPTRQCATVAIRNTSCALNKENILEYDHGLHMTMTRRAAIIVHRDKFPEVFYVSVLAETDDEPCGLPANFTGRSRTKSYVFNIHEHDESIGFLFLPLVIIPICSMVFIFGSIYLKYSNEKDKKTANNQHDRERSETLESIPSPAQIQTTDDQQRRATLDSLTDELMPMTIAGFEIPHTRVDFIPLIISLIIVPVFLDVLSNKMDQYHKYGMLDACQYNMECSFPVGYLPDVGRAVTSLTYVFVGFTLLLLVFAHHRRASLQNVSDFISGVQHDYDMLRAISYCLIFQGFIGFIYHVCPNESVESLADVFLLLAVSYTCHKIYQNRHPDVRHQIFKPIYVTVFFVGMHGMISVPIHRESIVTWVIFGGIHAVLTISVPVQFILLESFTISLHPYLVYQQLPMLRIKLSKIPATQMICILTGTALNFLFVVLFCSYQPPNFKTYLIPVFILNLLLYLAHYLAMKILHHREKISSLALSIMILSLFSWFFALYHLIFNTSISPGIAPAISRERAKSCVVLDMFDGHDAWHFLSAAALFLTVFLVMIVDDRQRYVQTCHLPVF